ncbi:unnamed protein product [Acidithrix sp. C25]|nr:unnamed protein product [Acidithrix sp. C25]
METKESPEDYLQYLSARSSSILQGNLAQRRIVYCLPRHSQSDPVKRTTTPKAA